MQQLEPYQYSRINPKRWSEKEIEKRQNWTCLHRHNGIRHAACFNTAFDIQERKGCLDIEAGALDADFDLCISHAIKTVGQDEYWYDHLTHQDIVSGAYDSRIIATLVDSLWRFDRIIGHYCIANRFDIPFVRSRYLWLKARKLYDGPPFPEYGQLWVSDTYSMAKRCLKIASRRQDSVANTVQGKDIKTKIDKDRWLAIKYGNKTQRTDAIKYITEHNLLDAEQLEANYIALLPYVREVRNSI